MTYLNKLQQVLASHDETLSSVSISTLCATVLCDRMEIDVLVQLKHLYYEALQELHSEKTDSCYPENNTEEWYVWERYKELMLVVDGINIGARHVVARVQSDTEVFCKKL